MDSLDQLYLQAEMMRSIFLEHVKTWVREERQKDRRGLGERARARHCVCALLRPHACESMCVHIYV